MSLKIIKFEADYCGACKAMQPMLDAALKNYPDVELVRIDTDQDFDLPLNYNIMSLPTLLFLKNNVEVARKVGITNETEFLELLNRFI